jgi:peptidoglycan/LPS O-acetylase OafA/YrhL
MSAESSYRPDIDGLRTLAVIPVILFHAGFSSLGSFRIAPGGYVGVDVFFVISGFLISRIIYSEVNSRSYSVVGFYSRRVKRIFPALFVVYLVCLALGATRGIMEDAAEIRNAVVASIFFVSNVYFAAHAGYFDSALQSNPLLHTWSLSIEEQFYIIFPIILLALRKQTHQMRITVLGLLALASLGASIYLTRTAPDVAYYSMAARAWELALGGLLGIVTFRRLAPWQSEALGVAGLLAIVTAVVFFSKTTSFPGYAALLPTLGAAAIILSGTDHRTAVARFLGCYPMRQVGLISYSLYLWHWPVLVFMRQAGYSSRSDALVAIAICFVLSWLSWRFVEQPFRKTGPAIKPQTFVAGGAAVMAITAILAFVSVPLNTILLPMSDHARTIAQFDTQPSIKSMRGGSCFLNRDAKDFSVYRKDECLFVDPTRANVLLLGDSHAAQYFEALRQANPDANILQATASGCLPLLNTRGERRCEDLFHFVTEEFLPKNRMDVIIISGRWSEGAVDRAYKTAEKLLAHAGQIIIIGPNIEFASDFPRVLVAADVHKEPNLVDFYISRAPRQVDKEFLSRNGAKPGVSYISYYETMCRQGCPTFSSSGDPLLFDENHLSLSAALDFVKIAGLSFGSR